MPASAWPCTSAAAIVADADDAEQQEGECRADEAVYAVRGIDGAEQREGAGGRQDAWHIGAGSTLDRYLEAGAADELAAADQNQSEQARHGQPHAGAEDSSLDRIADEEQPAERQRHSADPDRPARAERGLDVGLFRRGFCCRGLRRRGGR